MISMLITALEELDEEYTKKMIKRCISSNIPYESIWRALNQGLKRVGDKYESGEYTITDLMVAGIIFKDVSDMLPIPDAASVDIGNLGKKVVLGTVEGDIHDIGKSIFKGAMEASGFSVIDLGVNVKAEVFVDSVLKFGAPIVGISAVLTDSIIYVKETIDAFEKAGIRDKIRIILGGCIANKTVGDFVGADAFTKNAIKGVEICREWVQNQ